MKENFSQPWKKIAETWKRFGPGARPSRQNIKDMEKFLLPYIKNKKVAHVLVMGATPEIRDMLASYKNIEVTLLDMNLEMMLAMTDLMKRKNKQENWMVGNWLTAPLQHNYFDAVLADFTKGNLPYDRQPLLYQHIAEMLKPGGALIERLYSRFKDTPVYDVEKLLKKYSRIKPTHRSAGELWNYLVFMIHRDPVSPSDRPYQILEKYKDWPHMKEYKKLMYDLVPPGKMWHYGRGWEYEKRPVLKYFTIKDKRPDNTVYKAGAFVFELRPKK